jgi:competence protein ComGF
MILKAGILKNRFFNKNLKGASLIETLVCLAVIVILSSVTTIEYKSTAVARAENNIESKNRDTSKDIGNYENLNMIGSINPRINKFTN